jgi:hypothetical protein
MTLNRGFCYDARVNFGGEAMIMRPPRTSLIVIRPLALLDLAGFSPHDRQTAVIKKWL